MAWSDHTSYRAPDISAILTLRRARPKYALCARGNPWRCSELIEAADWCDLAIKWTRSGRLPRLPTHTGRAAPPLPRRQLVSYDPTRPEIVDLNRGWQGAQ